MTSTIETRLAQASQGLTYTSEADHPFTVVRFAGERVPVSQLTPAHAAELLGMPGAGEQWTLDRFFAPHIADVDPADSVSMKLVPRYESLRQELLGQLGVVRVFRAGGVEKHVAALGNDPATGELVGLRTVAVES